LKQTRNTQSKLQTNFHTQGRGTHRHTQQNGVQWKTAEVGQLSEDHRQVLTFGISETGFAFPVTPRQCQKETDTNRDVARIILVESSKTYDAFFTKTQAQKPQ